MIIEAGPKDCGVCGVMGSEKPFFGSVAGSKVSEIVAGCSMTGKFGVVTGSAGAAKRIGFRKTGTDIGSIFGMLRKDAGSKEARADVTTFGKLVLNFSSGSFSQTVAGCSIVGKFGVVTGSTAAAKRTGFRKTGADIGSIFDMNDAGSKEARADVETVGSLVLNSSSGSLSTGAEL